MIPKRRTALRCNLSLCDRSFSRKVAFSLFNVAGSLILALSAWAANPSAEHREKAEFFFFHGDTMRAIEEYEQSLKFEPTNWQAHLSLASLYLRKDENQKAREHLLEVIKIRPKDSDARILLAQVFTKSGDDISATQQLETVLSLGRQPDFLHTLLGFAYLRSGNLPKAEEQFRLSTSGKDDYTANTGLALVYLKQGKQNDALKAIDKTIAANNSDADAHKIKGDILTLCKKNEEAAHEYQTAVQLRPDFCEALLAHGNIYFASGDMANAVELFKKATHCQTVGPQCYYALALALEKSGQLTEAAGEYINGAFLEKDKSLAMKIQAHAMRLRSTSQIGVLAPQEVASAQHADEKLRVLKHMTPEEIFGINYDKLIGRQPSSAATKSETLSAGKSQKDQRTVPGNQ